MGWNELEKYPRLLVWNLIMDQFNDTSVGDCCLVCSCLD